MPNWCQNVMYIQNHNPSLVKAIKEGNLCEHIVPEPKDDEGEPTSGWYDWRVENWGTKWDIKYEYLEVDDDDTLIVKFDTAWSPPDKVFDAMHKKGYAFEAYYVEYGMEYYGSYVDGRDTTNNFPDGKFYPSDMHDDYEGWSHPNRHLRDNYS